MVGNPKDKFSHDAAHLNMTFFSVANEDDPVAGSSDSRTDPGFV